MRPGHVVLLGVLSVAICSPALDVSAHEIAVSVVERGIYTAETEPSPAGHNRVHRVRNIELKESTTTVPGQVGLRFGLRYLVSGAQSASAVPIRLVTRYPAQGLPDPESSERLYHREFQIVVRTASMGYWEFHFDRNWEVVPGEWSFEFWQGTHKLGEQKFCVLPPERDKRPIQMPTFCDFLSS